MGAGRTPLRSCGEAGRRGDEEAPQGEGGREGYSQGDRAVGQRVRGQDLGELQAAAHHLALGGTGRPAGRSGSPVVLAARGQRPGAGAASQQRQQRERQQQQRRRRLHAAGRGLRAERWRAGLAGRPGAWVGGGAARARRRPEPHGGRRTGPARRRHAPLSAAAGLGLRGAGGGSRPRGPQHHSAARRERRLQPRRLPAAPLPAPSRVLPHPLRLPASPPRASRRPRLREGGARSGTCPAHPPRGGTRGLGPGSAVVRLLGRAEESAGPGFERASPPPTRSEAALQTKPPGAPLGGPCSAWGPRAWSEGEEGD